MTVYQHKTLADGRWNSFSFSQQMANIGSEVSRAIKWKKKGRTDQMEKAVIRCLELIDLTVLSRQKHIAKTGRGSDGTIRELMRNREVICDYFFGDNEYDSKDESLMKYFDQFAMVKTVENAEDYRRHMHE